MNRGRTARPTPRCGANCRLSLLSRRRWQSEWQGGHVVNATHMAGLQDYSDGTVPSQLMGCTACNIALYCYSGVRSRASADKLASLGFTGGLYDGQGIVQWQDRQIGSTQQTGGQQSSRRLLPAPLTRTYYICRDTQTHRHTERERAKGDKRERGRVLPTLSYHIYTGCGLPSRGHAVAR